MWLQRADAEGLPYRELRKTMRLFYAAEQPEPNDGPVESLLETVRQFSRDYLRLQAILQKDGKWTAEVKAGYKDELRRVFETLA